MGPRSPLVVAPVVAVTDAPRLRRDLVVRRIPGPDETAWVVKDPVTRKYFRFPEASGRLLSYLDGQTLLLNLPQRLRAGGVAAPSIGALESLVQQLRALDLLELSSAERMEHQLEQMQTDRRLRARTRNAHGSLLHYRISLWDPDRWMERVAPRLGFFWTPAFVLLTLIALIGATSIIVVDWHRFAGEMLALISGQAGLPRYGLLILVSLVVIVIHELGHGLTCKRFGGHVHELGFLLLYFTPCFYCNVTDAWLFERRSARLWVTLAGVTIELFVGALATFVWWATEPGHPVNVIAFQTALLSSLGAVLLNLNPLLKQDGYYALADYLGVPNLREHAFRYLGSRLQRSLFGSQVAIPRLSDRRRRILITYGLLAGVYSVSLLMLFAFRTFDILVRSGRDWGVAGFLALVVGLIGLPVVRKTAGLGRSDVPKSNRDRQDRQDGRGGPSPSGHPVHPGRFSGSPERLIAWLLLAGLLIALAAIPRWSMPVRLNCVFEPDQEVVLYSPEDARVIEVLFAEGQRVEAGQPLLRLQPRGLSGDRAREVLEQRDERAGRLTLSSPAAGICLTPRPDELLGQAVTRGAPLLTIGDASGLVAVVRVDPDKSWDLREGALVLVQPHSRPGTTLRGRARTIVPAGDETAAFLRSGPDPATRAVGHDPWRPALSSGDLPSPGERSEGLRLSVPVINPGALRPGMTGSVKMYGPARSLLGHLREAALRLIRADLWG